MGEDGRGEGVRRWQGRGGGECKMLQYKIVFAEASCVYTI